MNLEEINKAIKEYKEIKYVSLFWVEFKNILKSKFWLITSLIMATSTYIQFVNGRALWHSLITSYGIVVVPILWGIIRCVQYRTYNKEYKQYLQFSKSLYEREQKEV